MILSEFPEASAVASSKDDIGCLDRPDSDTGPSYKNLGFFAPWVHSTRIKICAAREMIDSLGLRSLPVIHPMHIWDHGRYIDASDLLDFHFRKIIHIQSSHV